MHYDLILKNGTLVTPQQSIKADIAVKDGKIAFTGILGNNDTADDTYDAQGNHILPGIIDAHVHFRDPGLTEKEDFETGSRAAAFGGITTVADMPNVLPVTSTVERFNEKLLIAKEKSYVDFALFALLTENNTCEIEGLMKAGALGFKVFLGTSTGEVASPSQGILYEQMCKCAEAGVRIGFHAETSGLNSYFTSLFMKRDDLPPGLRLSQSRPVFSEALAIQTALLFAQYTGAKIHIHHVTCKDGVLSLAAAKKNNLNITAETCPHYLILNTDTPHKVYPPIREEEHRKGLWEGITDKVIDMIASDHAPHTASEKALPLTEAPAGLSGTETFVNLMLNEVNKGNLSLNDFVRLASENPAKIWGIYPQKGNLNPGADADFTIVDMDKKTKIDKTRLHSKSKTSPYDGMETQGAPIATIVRGKFIMKDGKFTGNKGYGSLVKPDYTVNPAP